MGEAVSFETTYAISLALRGDWPKWQRSPRSSPNWRVTGSRRYGCLNDENWHRCIELAGYPQKLPIRAGALWTGLMLEEVGVSRTAAQQLAWALSSGAGLPLGPALFHAYSVALGQSFPVDAWIPLWISWERLHCGEEDCELPQVEASRIAVLRAGAVTQISGEQPAISSATALLLVYDAGATWGEITAAAVSIAPARCVSGDTSPECSEPWVTIWLTSDAL
ncbi:MAG: hypothetical protein R6X02_07495 [Enhygromyxa sp.]